MLLASADMLLDELAGVQEKKHGEERAEDEDSHFHPAVLDGLDEAQNEADAEKQWLKGLEELLHGVSFPKSRDFCIHVA